MKLGLLLTLLVGLFILGGTIIGKLLKNNKNVLDFSICLSFGVLISLSILELFPEVIENLVMTLEIKGVLIGILGVLSGFLVLYHLDRLIPHHENSNHHHHHKHSNCFDEHLKHIALITSIALVLHNIIEGMGLYMATKESFKVGILLCIGIGLHNLPMGLMIESTLRNEYKFIKILLISLVVSLSTFVGGIIATIFRTSEPLMGFLLAITLGMLAYITIIELLPQITNIKNKKLNK